MRSIHCVCSDIEQKGIAGNSQIVYNKSERVSQPASQPERERDIEKGEKGRMWPCIQNSGNSKLRCSTEGETFKTQ